jgi:hypothetical protein
MSGIQYVTSYNYSTISGNTCTDITTTSRSCTPPDAIAPTITDNYTFDNVWTN